MGGSSNVLIDQNSRLRRHKSSDNRSTRLLGSPKALPSKSSKTDEINETTVCSDDSLHSSEDKPPVPPKSSKLLSSLYGDESAGAVTLEVTTVTHSRMGRWASCV